MTIEKNKIYKLMKIVSQKICTVHTTMSIVHSEKRAFRPLLISSGSWLHDIQDNWYSIFIVISDEALICIGCVLWGETKKKILIGKLIQFVLRNYQCSFCFVYCFDNSVSLERAFCWFMIWKRICLFDHPHIFRSLFANFFVFLYIFHQGS